MDFVELNYILSIAKHKNITKAATTLFISQPSLSKFLNKTETELGIKLFERIGKEYELTYAGELYVETAYQILALKKQLDRQLYDIKNDKKGRIHLAFSRIRGSHVLPNVLPKFSEEFPEVKIEVTEAQSAEIEQKLLSREVDLAIMNKPIKNENINTILIQKDFLLLATSANNPKIKYKKKIGKSPFYWIDLSLFSDEPFILTGTSQRTRELANKALDAYNIKPYVSLTTQSLETSIKLAANSDGVCFTPESFTKLIHTPINPKYFLIGEPPITTDLVAAYIKGAYLSKPMKRLIEIYKDSI